MRKTVIARAVTEGGGGMELRLAGMAADAEVNAEEIEQSLRKEFPKWFGEGQAPAAVAVVELPYLEGEDGNEEEGR